MGAGFNPAPFLHQDEGQHYERKSLLHGPAGDKRPRPPAEVRAQVSEVVASMANAEGGVLILGIEDDGTPTGHHYHPDELARVVATTAECLRPAQPVGVVVPHGEVELVVYEVPASDTPVRIAGAGFVLRVGDHTMQSTERQIQAVKLHGMGESWESLPSPLTLADLDADLLARARRGAGREDWTDETWLVARKLADRHGAGLVLRRAAELLFASRQSDVAPPQVRVFRVVGTERREGRERNVEERPPAHGPLAHVLDASFRTVESLLRRPTRLVGTRMREVPEYPEAAWQEAILNAALHRDYGRVGRAIEVWMFDDRMEVSSPGGLLPGVSMDDLTSGLRVHRSRNPRLVRALQDLGAVRNHSEGLPRMFAEMAGMFLPEPVLQVGADSFTVILGNTPKLTRADRAFVASLGDTPLTDLEFRALQEAHRRGHVEAPRLHDLTGVDKASAAALLAGLAVRGLLVVTGVGTTSHYALPRP